HREDLTRAAVVERGAEARVDAEALPHQLVMRIDVVRAAADDAVDVLVGQSGLVERLLHGVLEEAERAHAFDAPAPALAGADDGLFVAKFAHLRSCLRCSSVLDGSRSSALCSPSAGEEL